MTQEVFLPTQPSAAQPSAAQFMCEHHQSTIQIHGVTICRTAMRSAATLGAASVTSDN